MENKVLISGGGIAGLTMALFLNKAGYESKVIEQHPFFEEAGGNFFLNKSGVRVLKNLGLADAIKENSHSAKQTKVYDVHDRLMSIQRSNEGEEFGENAVFMSRSHLVKILLNEINKQGIELVYGKKLQSLSEETDGVTVYFEDGTNESGSLLIGADGTNSSTRKAIFPHHHLRYDNTWALYGVVSLDKLSEAKDFFNQDENLLFLKDNFGIMVGRSHMNDKINLAWQIVGHKKRKMAKQDFEGKSIDEVKRDFEQLTQEWTYVPELIQKSDVVIPKQIFKIDPLPSWSLGRVALIGDAAHTTSPNAGYGSPFALEEAMYLSLMLKDNDYQDAYFYYEFDRKERVTTILESLEYFDFSKGTASGNASVFGLSQDEENYKINWGSSINNG